MRLVDELVITTSIVRILKFPTEREGGIRPTMLLGNADLVVLKADFHTLRDMVE